MFHTDDRARCCCCCSCSLLLLSTTFSPAAAIYRSLFRIQALLYWSQCRSISGVGTLEATRAYMSEYWSNGAAAFNRAPLLQRRWRAAGTASPASRIIIIIILVRIVAAINFTANNVGAAAIHSAIYDILWMHGNETG